MRASGGDGSTATLPPPSSSLIQNETEGRRQTEEEKPDSESKDPPMHVVMVGVPAEVAVAIALGSFAIGALLMGLLCCIHHRKTTKKEVRTKSNSLKRRNMMFVPFQVRQMRPSGSTAATDGSELQSMLPRPAEQQDVRIVGAAAENGHTTSKC